MYKLLQGEFSLHRLNFHRAKGEELGRTSLSLAGGSATRTSMNSPRPNGQARRRPASPLVEINPVGPDGVPTKSRGLINPKTSGEEEGLEI
jgi:hypothetical protein